GHEPTRRQNDVENAGHEDETALNAHNCGESSTIFYHGPRGAVNAPKNLRWQKSALRNAWVSTYLEGREDKKRAGAYARSGCHGMSPEPHIPTWEDCP